MANADLLKNYIAKHQDALQKLHTATADDFAAWVRHGVAALQGGNKILFFGNGGSAAEAQHIAAELSIKFMQDRPALAGLALTTDTSALTAAGNDYGFDHIFARQIAALGQKGDMAVGYSTSGRSPNVIRALAEARQRGMVTVGLTGAKGGEMRAHCDVCLVAPSEFTSHIQEMHNILGHAFCAGLEDGLNLIPQQNSPWKN